MKCPKCSKELPDTVSFCGYCGSAVAKESEATVVSEPNLPKEVSETAGILPTTSESTPKTATPPMTVSTEPKKKKNRKGLKVLLAFLIVAIIAGGSLGFITARGIVDWREVFDVKQFVWTDFSEGMATTEEQREEPEEEKPKDNVVVEVPEEIIEKPEPNQPPSEPSPDTQPEDQTTEIEPSDVADSPETAADLHYAKHCDETLVILDDKAHVLSEDLIPLVFEKAKEVSVASECSIMFVLTRDLLGLTSEEFASEYFSNMIEQNREGEDLGEDGFLFLIDITNGQHYIVAAGDAGYDISGSKKEQMLSNMESFLEFGDYTAALVSLLNDIPV